MPQVNTRTVIAALERNFGGNSAAEFSTIVDTFLLRLRSACGPDDFPAPQVNMYRNTLDVLKDSLADSYISGEHLGNQQASLSNVAARPILLIDQTGQAKYESLTTCNAQMANEPCLLLCLVLQ